MLFCSEFGDQFGLLYEFVGESRTKLAPYESSLGSTHFPFNALRRCSCCNRRNAMRNGCSFDGNLPTNMSRSRFHAKLHNVFHPAFKAYMTVGFPPPRARPGLFMCCGPPAFTILCLLGLSTFLWPFLPISLYEPLYALALASSTLLWLISAWFYLLTLASILNALADRKLRGKLEFILAWWAAIFPITGWANATWELGGELASAAVKGVARGMVVVLIVVFVRVTGTRIRAVVKGLVMKKGKDEDRVIDAMLHRYQPSTEKGRDGEKVEDDEGEGKVESGLRSNNPPNLCLDACGMGLSTRHQTITTASQRGKRRARQGCGRNSTSRCSLLLLIANLPWAPNTAANDNALVDGLHYAQYIDNNLFHTYIHSSRYIVSISVAIQSVIRSFIASCCRFLHIYTVLIRYGKACVCVCVCVCVFSALKSCGHPC